MISFKNQYTIIAYALIVLLCLTFSQKIPDTTQHWPFLYIGIVLIFIGSCYMLLNVVASKKIVIPGIIPSSLYFFLLFMVSLDVIINPQARNAFILNIILIHIFPLVFIYISNSKKIDVAIDVFAKTLCSFAILQAVIAWYFIEGGSFALLGIEYKHVMIWGGRLHGVIGEPTHFGLLQGIGIISLFYLYRRKQSLQLTTFRSNVFFVIVSVFFIVSVLFSGSRNALVSSILSLLVYCVFDRNARKVTVKYLSIVIIPIIFVLAYAYYKNLLVSLDKIRLILRFDDATSENVRMAAISRNLQYINEFDFSRILFGNGYADSLNSTTSFNQYVDILRDYGVIWTVVGILLLFVVFYTYVLEIRSGWFVGTYPIALLIYSLSVFMFYAAASNVFHVVSFTFVWIVLLSFLLHKKVVVRFSA